MKQSNGIDMIYNSNNLYNKTGSTGRLITSQTTSFQGGVRSAATGAAKKLDKPLWVMSEKVTNIFKKFNILGPEQRILIGVTGLFSQPLIDYYNKSVDEDTRKYSAAKSFVKTFVGTSVGYVVRSACISWGNKLVDNKFINARNKVKHTPKYLEKFKGNLGTFLGTFACLFTNFLIDVPFNNAMLNWVVKKYDLNPEAKKVSLSKPQESPKGGNAES